MLRHFHPPVKNPEDINAPLVFTEKNHMAFFDTGEYLRLMYFSGARIPLGGEHDGISYTTWRASTVDYQAVIP